MRDSCGGIANISWEEFEENAWAFFAGPEAEQEARAWSAGAMCSSPSLLACARRARRRPGGPTRGPIRSVESRAPASAVPARSLHDEAALPAAAGPRRLLEKLRVHSGPHLLV